MATSIFTPKPLPRAARGNIDQLILDKVVQPKVFNVPFVPDVLEDLFAGIGGGTAGLLAQGVGLVNLAVPSELGSSVKKKLQEAAALPPPSGSPREFSEIGIEDSLNFAAFHIGEAIPSVVAFAGAGAPFAAAGRGAQLAAGLGLFGALNTGDVYATAREEGRSPETAVKLALAMGGSQTLLDGVFFHHVGGRLVANTFKDAIAKGLVTSSQRDGIRKAIKQVGAAAVADSALFSLLSTTKEVSNAAIEKVLLNKDITQEELLVKMLNAAASGAVVGGALGGGSEAIGASRRISRGRKGRDLEEGDFTPEVMKKLLNIDPEAKDPLVVGHKYTKGESTYEILEVDPLATQGVGAVKVRVEDKSGVSKIEDFSEPAFRRGILEKAEGVEKPREGLQVSEAFDKLGKEESKRIVQELEDGTPLREIKGPPEFVEALSKVIRPLEKEEGPRQAKESKEVEFDPEPIERAGVMPKIGTLPKAPESLDVGLSALKSSGKLGEALESLSRGDSLEVAVSKIGGTGVSDVALSRALGFVSERVQRTRTVPEGLVVGNVEVRDSVNTEVLNRLGVLTEGVELLKNNPSSVVAKSLKKAYQLSISESELIRMLDGVKAPKREVQEGDYSAPESEAAIGAEVAKDAQGPWHDARLLTRDLITLVRGPGFEVHAGTGGTLWKSESVRVNYRGPKGDAKSLDLEFPKAHLLPISVYVSGRHKSPKAFEGAIKEYLSDFGADNYIMLPPVNEPLVRGFERSGRYKVGDRIVDVFASTENSAQTTKVRLRQGDGKVIESELQKKEHDDPDRVSIYVDGKVKNLQAFVIARMALQDTLFRSRSSSIYDPYKVSYTKAGTEVKDLSSEGLYDKFVAGKPEVEAVVDATTRSLDRIRKTISGLTPKDEAKVLKDDVLSIGGLLSDKDFGITINQVSWLDRPQASVYVDPFTDLSGRGSPTGLASRVVQTIIHEIAHVPVIATKEGHKKSFWRRMKKYSELAGDKEIQRSIEEIAKELDDGTGKFKPGVADAVQGLTEASRRRISGTDVGARAATVRKRPSGLGLGQEAGTEGPQRGRERDFWSRETGEIGENLDRFMVVRGRYEDYLRDAYRGRAPSGLLGFKDFARKWGIDPDTVDAGSPEHIVEGLKAKDVLDMGLKGVEREVARADIERVNKLEAMILGLHEFVKKIPSDAEANQYLGLRVEERTLKSQFAIGVNHITLKMKNIGSDQAGRAVAFLAERSNISRRLGRKLDPKENVKLAKEHGVNEFGLEVVKDTETMLESGLGLVRTELEGRVERILGDDPELKAARLKDIEKDFGKLAKLNYYPFMRFGKHVIKVEAPVREGKKRRQVVTREHFEVEGDMRDRLKEVLREFPQSKGFKVTTPLLDDTGMSFQGFPPALLDSIKGRLDLTESQVGELRDLMVSMNPGQGFFKHLMKRQGTPGFSREGERNLIEYFSSMASHISGLRFGHQFDEIVGRVKEQTKQLQDSRQFDAAKQRRIVEGVLESHNEYSKDPGNELSAIRGGLFKYFIAFGPKQIAVQLTQVPFYTLPELTARGGKVNGAGVAWEIGKAYRTVWNTFDLTRPNHFDNLHKTLRMDQSNMLTQLFQEGVLTDSLAKMMSGKTTPRVLVRLHKKLGAVDRAIDTLGEIGLDGFQGAEEVNRRVTALSSFEVALKNGKGFDASVDFARSMVNDTQFVYAPYNKIPLARGGTSKVEQLRSMAFFLRTFNVFSTNFALSSKGRAQFNLQMLVMAGVAGMPAAELALSLVDTIVQKAGGPDPFGIGKPKFQSREWVQELSETLGLRPNTLLHGLSHNSFGLPALMRAMGGNFPEFDLSASIGLGNVIPGVEPFLRLAQETTSFSSAVTQSALEIGGPGASFVGTVARAVSDDGPGATMLRQATPIGMRNLIKAYGLVKDEGHVDRQGNVLIDYDVHNPLQAAEILGQALGFRPSIMADVSEANFLQKEFETYVNNLREQLLSQYALAVQTRGDVKAVTKQVGELNRALPPAMRITSDALKRSLRERVKNATLRQWGLPRMSRFRGTEGPLREEVNVRLRERAAQ